MLLEKCDSLLHQQQYCPCNDGDTCELAFSLVFAPSLRVQRLRLHSVVPPEPWTCCLNHLSLAVHRHQNTALGGNEGVHRTHTTCATENGDTANVFEGIELCTNAAGERVLLVTHRLLDQLVT